MKKFFATICAAGLLMTGCGGGNVEKSEPVELHVSAAASLTNAMNELAELYTKDNPNVKIIFNFGSSGALQQAIENGGETDLFFSAAQKQMNALDEAGELAEGTRKDLLRNEVVLIVPIDSDKNISDFNDAATAKVEKIALGEPKGVPVGQYSEEIFSALNILDAVKAKAVYGSDVRQVLAWTESGEVDCGVVYATDAAISDKVKVICAAPDGTHKPVIYPAAAIKSSKNLDAAKKFLDFTGSDAAKKVFVKYGFDKMSLK
ncbi:MAG: molybdate ABC transporter substrate-binding protein [Quinella sp. 3Q1]|nr:molybdate ABC transporter substrate-binding protein [Quinella sp. 3Q1]MBR3051026.1 molybdate ABC transporter substrate-binding protein [Selenomonadaceae bacterium]MBR6887983.1 molybdate ABC transporter substrate-binding protein [Selenomonadaceae bacterium]